MIWSKNKISFAVKFASIFLLVIMIVSISGCKIYSFTGASIPADVKTVQVDLFDNRANGGPAYLTQNFTNKLRLKMVTEGNLRQVSTNGDIVFKGYFNAYQITSQAPTAQSLAGVNRLRIAVHVIYTNTKNENDNFESDFDKFIDYSGSENLINIEAGLVEEINRQLVDDIFNKALVKW